MTQVWISIKRAEKSRPTVWQMFHLRLGLYVKELDSSTSKCELFSYSWKWRTSDVCTVNWWTFVPLPAGWARLQHSVVRLSLLDHRECCIGSHYIRPQQWEFPTRVPVFGSCHSAVWFCGYCVHNTRASSTEPAVWTQGSSRWNWPRAAMAQLTETNERKDLEHSLLHVIYLLQFIYLPSGTS